MSTYQFRPIAAWPRPFTKGRRSDPFKRSFVNNLADLERELSHLGARNVVIQTAHREEDIRQDGMPRATARKPSHPGVIVSFDSKAGPLSFAVDTYEEWTGNLRAITLTLESLRAVDRYGATRHSEQYKGWAALPPPRPAEPETFVTRFDAARFIVTQAGMSVDQITVGSVMRDPAQADAAYRAAAKRLHPDAGGDAEQFKRLGMAREALRGLG